MSFVRSVKPVVQGASVNVKHVVPDADKYYVWTIVDGKAKRVEVTLAVQMRHSKKFLLA